MSKSADVLAELRLEIGELASERRLFEERFSQRAQRLFRSLAPFFSDDERSSEAAELITGFVNSSNIAGIRDVWLRQNVGQFKAVPSYRISHSLRTVRKSLGDRYEFAPEWHLDSKINGQKFAAMSGVKTPSSVVLKSFDDIPHSGRFALKPMRAGGSRGVFLLRNERSGFVATEVLSGDVLIGRDALMSRIEERVRQGKIKQNVWILEDEIVNSDGSPCRELKFFSFYGEVGLVLERISFPEIRYCWWSPSGERVSTGKYENKAFHGKGFDAELLKDAIKLSHAVPAPFLRIDFMVTDEGWVFGEFTPRPGNYEDFNDMTDTHLGQLYLAAEGRLSRDLIFGKLFPVFSKLFLKDNRP